MPGTIITEKTAQITRSAPVQVGTAFLAGRAQKGPANIAVEIRSDKAWEETFGDEIAGTTSRQEVRNFFGKGGSRMFFARIVGGGAVNSDVDLLDNDGQVSLVASAVGPGTFYDAYNIDVVPGDGAGQFKLRLTSDTDPTVDETSPSFADRDSAIGWASRHSVYRLTLGAADEDPDPAVGAVSFAGGAEDAAGINDARAQAALDLFHIDLGPGQVSFIGRSDTTARQQLLNHAANNRRAAILPLPNVSDAASLLALGAEIKGLDNSRKGAPFAPWLEGPARAPGVPGAFMSPVTSVMARIAANDSAGNIAGEPAAGDMGIIPNVAGLAADLRPIMDVLTEANINCIIEDEGAVKIYGFRSGADKQSEPLHWQFGHTRLYMQIAAEADRILKRHVHRLIDGQRLRLGKLEGQLIDALAPFYTTGGLYAPAIIDVDSVNTADTAQDGQLWAAIDLVMSSMGETVHLDIYRRAIA